jgi:hypothetical protein
MAPSTSPVTPRWGRTNPSRRIAASQCASCGESSGPALQVQETFGDTTVNSGEAALGFVNNTFSYGPSTEGAIFSIDASVDKDGIIEGITATFGNTFRPLIEQDGNYYLASITGASFNAPGTSGFVTISRSGLVAADFVQFDFTTGVFGTATPNFAGDPMLFGLAQITSVGGYPPSPQLAQDYNNLSIDIAPVPEPSSVWLLVGMLPLLGLALRRRRFN